MTKERDDVLHKLGQVYEFYDKKPTNSHVQFWLNALNGYRPDEILAGFDQHIARGKYMPKPVEIITIMDEQRSLRRARGTAAESHGQQTPEIAQAWITYMRFAFGMSLGARALPDAPAMPLEQALEIVNREAAKYDRPDSILPEHRIESYWGSAA